MFDPNIVNGRPTVSFQRPGIVSGSGDDTGPNSAGGVGGALMVPGAGLTATGYGALIGIPMMLGGLGAGIYGMMRSHPDPIHPYSGSYGYIGPNALGRGNNLQMRYDGLVDSRSKNAPWYENQNEYMRQFARNLTPDFVKGTLSKSGLITHKPGDSTPSPLGQGSTISSILAPYFTGQSQGAPVSIGTTPLGR